MTPSIFVNVKEYQNGAEMLTVSSTRPGYPADLLQKQCEAVAANAKAYIRGLSIENSNLGNEAYSSITRASFATEHLIDRSTGALDVQSIVRAFAGAPEPWTCKGMVITFENEKPGFDTLKKLTTEAVEIASQVLQNPDGVEYRVHLISQVPEQISVPSLVPQQEVSKSAGETAKTVNPIVFVLLGIATLAAGALVYFSTLRAGSRR